MAWVFLTDCRAYKLKKPVRTDYLDFSTAEARRKDSEREVRLNRRLAADVYHGVAPLSVDRRGDLNLTGDGEPIDWLTEMRRLPEDRMLDALIARGAVDEDLIRPAALKLARFYRDATPVEIEPRDYRSRLDEDLRDCRRALLDPRYRQAPALVQSVFAALAGELAHEPERFDQRVAMRRVIDAHGDLRPEHICLESPPVIIDCLEFNRKLRTLDAASDLAFLTLECDRLGAAFLSAPIWSAYHQHNDDPLPKRLRSFYESFHAFVRAKVAIGHLDDDYPSTPAKWIEKATTHLRMARQRLDTLHDGGLQSARR